MTNPPPTPPDPALWTWTDQFDRTFLGPDYTAAGPVTLDGTAIKNGPMPHAQKIIDGQTYGGPQVAAVTLSAALWSGPDVQVQFDWRYQWANAAGDVYLQAGFLLYANSASNGQNDSRRALRWLNGTLHYGTLQQITQATQVGNSFAQISTRTLTPGTWQRVRLTVDTVQGRIQVQAGAESVDVALPADYLTEFAGGAELSLITQQGRTYDELRYITVWVDNLALRNGDGTADLSTGTANSSGSIRLGGEWRFADGPPDDSVGSEGDVWANRLTNTISRKENGTYVNAMTLLGIPGPQGEQGLQGEQGATGPQGEPGELVGAVAVPLLLGDATPDGGLLIPLTAGGGLVGYELLGVDGPATTVEYSSDGAAWVPVALPWVATAGTLRLTRTDDSGAVAVLRARSQPVQGGGSSPGFTVQTDPDGFPVYQEAQTSTDPDGYLTVTNATATTDPEGYVTLERTS